jgi:hypothetical protein
MTLRLNGSTSGYTEIDAPAVAGSNTLVLPGGNGSADQVLATNGSGTLSFVDRGRMVLETAKASTSGTSVDFTGIPNWVKKITVMFNGVSTNGTSVILIQLGDSGGVETTDYVSSATVAVGGSASINYTSTAGFIVCGSSSGDNRYGHVLLTQFSGNTWVQSQSIRTAPTASGAGGGEKTLSATLDRIRITTSNGTDTFDAGSINILYEG